MEENPKRKIPRITSDEDHLVSQKPVASLSVSELSEFYFYDCEKFLKLKSRQNHDEKNARITKGPTLKTSERHRGRKFEVEVENELRNLYGENVINFENVSNEANINLLKKAKVGQIFCQMSFKVNETFYEKFNLKGIIEIKDFRPDFIKVNKKSYEIIDAKSSKCVQSSHKFQVAIYAYLLNLMVRDIKVSNTCGIYLPPFNLQQISIKELLPEIKDLFRERLPRIIETSIQNLPWHFDSSCKNCYFVYNCKKEVKGTLALIPNLSRNQLKNIKRDLETEESVMNVELVNDVDIEDLVKYLSNTSADDERAKGIKKIIKYDEKLKISPYMKMKSGQAQFVGVATTDFPQDYNLLITMSLDTLSLKPFGWGICLYARDKKIKQKFRQSKSLSKDEDLNKVFISFMDEFTTLLVQCFEHLKSNNLKACAFVYSKKEKEYIQDSLIEIINLERSKMDLNVIKRKARICLFNLFEDSKLLSVIKNNEELPARNTREFPRLIVLEQSIRENVAICVPGFYCITDIWEQLVVPKLHDQVLLRSLKPHVKYIDFESIFTFWHSAGPKQVNKFQLLRIDFGYAVIEAYYDLLKESINDNSTFKLIFDAPEFTLASTKTFKNNYLGKLYYFKLLEARVECKDKKPQRMSDYLQNESAYGIKIQFEKFININSDRVTLFTTLSNEQELESDRHYKQFMLVEDSPEGILEAIRFSDLTHMDDQEVHFEQKSTFLCKTYRLYKRCINFNLNKVIDMLIEIDNRGVKSVFMDLLVNTNNWCKEELLEGRLKIVSGPASSDKVASLIMQHLSQPIDQNRNYIIGVTALSREAIENLLKGISVPKQVKIFNMVYILNNKSLNGRIVECEASTLPTKINKIGMPGNLIVIGGTVWDWHKLRKAWNRWPGCDIMLIDEGSQAISDASIAIECLKPKTGKLIIAGDTELKPYIRNKFPNDHPFLFGSIQQCLNSLIMRNNKH
ncbi:17730_t:CDS:10 [Funneliformis caledonium]|uniref:17730_t:CDS:1 n=1 Tax=Funneliformis caledonium TaxID=1117310 RepID=A0A9N9GH04_9GLOM|nr:17730_t:CDS:10 [Funneliformis caledonium]